MFLLSRPTPRRIETFLAAQRDAPFSYAEVGATLDAVAPAGYVVDHNRVRIGAGAADFARAADALRSWRMLTLGWASVQPAHAPVVPGTVVAIVVRHYGFWSLNACRIVHVLDDAAPDAHGVQRAGFVYGTLPAHGAAGEERFSVEWQTSDDGVWYDLYAFSRPSGLLARLGRPFARRLQRRFARASKQAMADAVSSLRSTGAS